MRFAIFLPALFAVTSASETRTQAMRYLAEKATEATNQARFLHGRHAQTNLDTGDMDMGDMDMGDMSELLCGLMGALGEEMEKEGLVCTCDPSSNAIAFACKTNASFDPMCDETGCIDEMEFTTSFPLDGGDANVATCVRFGNEAPDGMENKKVCVSVVMEMEEMDMTADPDADAAPKLKSCTASIDDQDCTCTICHGGYGFEIDCGDEFPKSECTDFSEEGGEVGATPAVARFAVASSAGAVPAAVPIAISGLALILVTSFA